MSHTAVPFPAATVLGYPRIGPDRELKKLVEGMWAGRLTSDEVEAGAAQLRRSQRAHLRELGLSEDAAIPSDFSFYDQVLDACFALGAIPARFGVAGTSLADYFTLARGSVDEQPMEMTKWFDSNYHYLVPEIAPETAFAFSCRRSVDEFTEALSEGVHTRPVIVGPLTFLLLAKAVDGAPAPIQRLDDVVGAYLDWLAAFAEAGASWVQIDEPALACDTWDVAGLTDLATAAYRRIAASSDRPNLLVALTYGDATTHLAAFADVEAVALDLVKGPIPAVEQLDQLAGVTLVAGVVNGRNIWANDLTTSMDLLETLREAAPRSPLAVATSTSLFHVPYDAARETQLPDELRSWLAFADQKVAEVRWLATGLADGRDAIAGALATSEAVRENRAAHPGVYRDDVRSRLARVTTADYFRGPYADRKAAQEAALQLPALPTTTIGSFPQTTEIRKARAAHRAGTLSDADYEAAMKTEIAQVIKLQEDLGLDVLVHGEAERNDMVQYFAELLDGFSATVHGWVQSYGSRCTRPSLLWGDVSRPAPMTVPWSTYAASCTDKPVKGMLTGPVTILAWSFVRDDQPLADTAAQVALALREEIADLEEAGISIIQVDEPALRELLPLHKEDQGAYLDWSVNAFRLATSGVADATQIHTHLCYSEFSEVIDAIDGLDADVTSIEAARSRMEVLPAIHEAGFERGIGPGVYDIHSPRVPDQAEIAELLAQALQSVSAEQLWVNPDCGLKTRGYAEVTPTLEHMVGAARQIRATL